MYSLCICGKRWALHRSIPPSWFEPLQFFLRGEKGRREGCWARLTIVVVWGGKVGIELYNQQLVLTISFLDYTGLTPSGLFSLQSILQGQPDYSPLLNPSSLLPQTKPLMATHCTESKVQTLKLIIQYFFKIYFIFGCVRSLLLCTGFL